LAIQQGYNDYSEKWINNSKAGVQRILYTVSCIRGWGLSKRFWRRWESRFLLGVPWATPILIVAQRSLKTLRMGTCE